MTTPPSRHRHANDDRDPIVRLHRGLVDDLAATLDLDAGAGEAIQPRHYARLASDLHETLDLDAGVAAIVGASGPLGAAVPRSEREGGTDALSSGSWASQLAGQILQVDSMARFALRTDEAHARTTDMLRVHLDLALDLVNACDLERALARDLSALISAFDRDPSLNLLAPEARARVLGLADDLERAIAHREIQFGPLRHDDEVYGVLAQALGIALQHVKILGEIARALLPAEPRGDISLHYGHRRLLDLVRGRLSTADALSIACDLVVPDAASFARALGCTVDDRPPAAEVLAADDIRYLRHVLDRVTNDFVGTDLRSATLDGARLEEILWSESTRWPAGWEEQVRAASVEIEPGIFQITSWGRPEQRTLHAVTT